MESRAAGVPRAEKGGSRDHPPFYLLSHRSRATASRASAPRGAGGSRAMRIVRGPPLHPGGKVIVLHPTPRGAGWAAALCGAKRSWSGGRPSRAVL
ncbi:unnamed protein product [Boreogadus saida]